MYFQISTHPRCLDLMIPFPSKLTTRIFPILSGIIPDEKPRTNLPSCFYIIPDDLKSLTSFLSFSCFNIIPDDSYTSILISLTNLSLLSPFFLTIGDLSLFLKSQMSSHVMYGSAGCMCKS